MFCLYNSFYNYIFKYCNFLFINDNFFKVNVNKKVSFNFFYNNIFINKFIYTQKLTNDKNFSYMFKYKNNYFYDFNKNNYFYFNNINNMLSSLFYYNFNILFLDSSSKMITPFYNYIFGTKNLIANKDFFFVKKENLTRTSWFYVYSNNIKRFNVGQLIILDYICFNKFLTVFKKFNLPILSLVPANIKSIYIDYFLIINKANLELSKFFLFNFSVSLYFKFNIFNFKKFKNIYFNKFNYYFKIIH